MPAVADWLRHAEATRRSMREKYRDIPRDPLVTDAARENVPMQIRNLCTHPAVATGLAAGRLTLHGWVYRISTGEVFAYDPARSRFRLITEIALDPAAGPAQLNGALRLQQVEETDDRQ